MRDAALDTLLAAFTEPLPFTRETVARAPLAPGAHVVILHGEIVYVGETGRTLRERLRAHLGGGRGSSVLHKQVGEMLDDDLGRQTTTAEVAAWLGRCEVRWRETGDPKALKDALLTGLRPRFNRLLPGRPAVSDVASRFDRLMDSPYFDAVVMANRAYLDAVVPDAATTEREYWALSCLPGTRTNPPRLSAVSMKTMETFVLHEPANPTRDARVEGFLVVRSSVLVEHWTHAGLQTTHPALTRWPSDYVDAGPDQELLAGSVDDLLAALADDRIVLAARALTEPLLRSRTLHARGHNQQLADAVLRRHRGTTDWIFPVEESGSELSGDVRELFHSHTPLDWRLSSGYHRMAAGDRIWACAPEPAPRLVASGIAWGDPYQRPTGSGLEWRVAIRWNAELSRHLLGNDRAAHVVSAGSVRGVREMRAWELDGLTDALGAGPSSEPDALSEGRRRRLAEVTARQGQADFRRRLVEAYGGRCAVTGCDTEAALQAAHISPYDGPATNRVTNGLLLRADVHNLFDRGLIWVDDQLRVRVREDAAHYARWHGEELRLPARTVDRPDVAALRAHRQKVAGMP